MFGLQHRAHRAAHHHLADANWLRVGLDLADPAPHVRVDGQELGYIVGLCSNDAVVTDDECGHGVDAQFPAPPPVRIDSSRNRRVTNTSRASTSDRPSCYTTVRCSP